jgi:hypothetical protein
MEVAHRLYELRRYHVADGRMQDEISRALSCIRSEAYGGLGLFDRYGISAPIGLWRVVDGAVLPCVIFLYEWPSVAVRASAFEAFYLDSEWNAVRSQTNGGTEIVDQMDDLLLVGLPVKAPSAGHIYSFSYHSAESLPSEPYAALSPLCGSDSRSFVICEHPSLGDALSKRAGDPERMIGELIDIGGVR